MKTLRLIASIILGIGCFLVFNESETFVPNFIGLACFVALIYINRNSETIAE